MPVPQNGSPRLQLQDEVLRGSECVLKCVLIEASEASGYSGRGIELFSLHFHFPR